MDPIKVKKTVRRMTEARAVLVKENPFFGHLSMGLAFACAPCGTACTDGNRLIFDPDFAEQLSDKEMQFVVLHELLHCVLEHCIRGKNRLQYLYNIACDEVVNSTILDMWGVRSFRLAGEYVMHLAPDGQEGRLYQAEEIYEMLLCSAKKKGTGVGVGGGSPKATVAEDSNQASALPKLPGGAASAKSAKSKNPKQTSAGLPSPDADDSQNPENAPGQAGGGQEANASGQAGNGPKESHFDRHDLWQGICDKERLRNEWDAKISDAAKKCKSFSNMPSNIRRMVEHLEKRSKLDWKQLLHDFLQFDEYDYSYLPPDRRFSDQDFFLPAYHVDTENGSARNIWVCVDTSASMGKDEISDAMAEILDAMRQANLSGTISFFDAVIRDPVPFETEDAFREITPVGGGGTSFQIIFDYLKEKLYPDLPKAILIFTDGYATFPAEDSALGVPVLWILSKYGTENAPWGYVAKM